MRRTAVWILLLVVGMAGAGPLAAQERWPVLADTVADSATVQRPDVPTPAGAFARSLLVPGWGQAAYGSYLRGGVYFAAQAGSWFMLFKTIAKIAEARDIRTRRVAFVRDSLLYEAERNPVAGPSFTEPGSLERAVEQDSLVAGIDELIDARKQQREDWIAWTIFWTLAGAADAYVTAQLADFPVDVAAEPRRQGGGVSLQVTVPAGGAP